MTQNHEDYELFHYGIKGMKWGVRRDDTARSRAKGYSDEDYVKDTRRFGKDGAKYVNKQMSEGLSLTEARKKAAKRQVVQARVILGASFVGTLAPHIIKTGVNHAINTRIKNARVRENNRDRADLMKDVMLTSYETIRLSEGPDGVWR